MKKNEESMTVGFGKSLTARTNIPGFLLHLIVVFDQSIERRAPTETLLG
jgi:hypothetical protein